MKNHTKQFPGVNLPGQVGEKHFSTRCDQSRPYRALEKGNDQTIEQEIQTKGLTAPRIRPGDIEANISSEHYFTAADGLVGNIDADGDIPESLELLTFCVIVLKNGFTVTGESACASPENFDAEIGRKIARQNAVQKIWPLMGYHLKEQLSHQQ